MVDEDKYHKAEKKLWERQKEWFGFEMDPLDEVIFGPISLEKELDKIIYQLKQSTNKNFSSDFPTIPVGILHSHMHEKSPQVGIFYVFAKDEIQYIAIDYRFLNFCYGTSLWALRHINLEINEENNDQQVTKSVRGFLSEFYRFNPSLKFLFLEDYDQEQSLSFDAKRAASSWVRTHKLFLVGHEYAHLILGHLVSERLIVLSRFDDERDSIKKILGSMNPLQEEEMEADYLSFIATMDITENDGKMSDADKNLSFIGLDFLFSVLELIDFFQKFNQNPGLVISHPSGTIRKNHWRKYFEKHARYRKTIGICDLLQQFFHQVINYYETIIALEIDREISEI